ncbi:ABC-2 family transporter [Herbinix hemicellulosilytica]|uniref:Putative membrane protein n=1 Tax=Herbinix hemicellulosilytica TaxID=1564487 RepID=A0A0H5SDJ6_HERHM|nr:ABC-2 transporter permease [Herbinix hemicellulosilytica]RBP57970.1 ABC-2 family transporter [Herbinix hemicellulosilytica]CRZ33479.1 putative membrane protein [Herbinix hemicellulosilytica]
MKGLIIKDLINIFKNVKVILLLLIFYGFISVMTDNPGSFIGVFNLLFAMYFLSTYSYDEYANWDNYALTMPVTREKIVLGKYLSMLLVSLTGFMISSAWIVLINYISKQDNIFEGIVINAAIIAAAILFFSVIIPVINKFGIIKARIYIIIIYMVPFLLGSYVFGKVKEIYPTPPEKLISFIEIVIKYVYIIVPLFLLVVLGISYALSVRIYRKKEF